MTSPALGTPDGEPRWLGLYRHQVVGLLTVMGALLQGLFSKHWRVPVLLIVMAAVVSVPLPANRTLGLEGLTLVRYVGRSRWFVIHTSRRGSALRLGCRSSVEVRLFTTPHVGRLDLSGRDREITALMRTLSSSLSASSTGGHVATYVVTKPDAVTTFLALRGSTTPSLVTPTLEVPLLTNEEVHVVRENWCTLDTADHCITVLRVHGFAPASERPLLEALEHSGATVTVGVLAAVVPAPHARRITARAVHRRGVDSVAQAAMGFRHSAHHVLTSARLQRREELVAAGASLLQVGVYVVVEASSRAEVGRQATALVRRTREVGLTLERGWGHQAQWFRWALPGGLEW